MRSLVILLLGFCLPVLGSAQALIDPTRPAGTAMASSVAGTAIPVLQLTLIRLGVEPLAVINGRTLRIGDAIAGRRVTAIQPGRVLLAGAEGSQVLALVVRKNSSTSSATSSLKRPPSL